MKEQYTVYEVVLQSWKAAGKPSRNVAVLIEVESYDDNAVALLSMLEIANTSEKVYTIQKEYVKA